MTALALGVRELTVDELDWIGGGPSHGLAVEAGLVVGTAAGIYGALEGAELGAFYGSWGGPWGMLVGGAAGAAVGYATFLYVKAH